MGRGRGKALGAGFLSPRTGPGLSLEDVNHVTSPLRAGIGVLSRGQRDHVGSSRSGRTRLPGLPALRLSPTNPVPQSGEPGAGPAHTVPGASGSRLSEGALVPGLWGSTQLGLSGSRGNTPLSGGSVPGKEGTSRSARWKRERGVQLTGAEGGGGTVNFISLVSWFLFRGKKGRDHTH